MYDFVVCTLTLECKYVMMCCYVFRIVKLLCFWKLLWLYGGNILVENMTENIDILVLYFV